MVFVPFNVMLRLSFWNLWNQFKLLEVGTQYQARFLASLVQLATRARLLQYKQ